MPGNLFEPPYEEIPLPLDGLAITEEAARALAQAWEAGYTSGHSNAMRKMSDEPNAPTTPNPYRSRRQQHEILQKEENDES